MTVIIQKVHDFIVKTHGGAYHNSGWELCKAVGIDYYGEFQPALRIVRSVAWKNKHGWTIPPVGQGRQYGPYAVVRTRVQTETYSVPGIRRRINDLIGHNNGVEDATAIALADLKPGTPEWTVAMAANNHTKATQTSAATVRALADALLGSL